MPVITLISDTHNRHMDLPPMGSGDLILHAGDATSRGRGHEIEDFLYWFGSLDFDKKIYVPGNHDFGLEDNPRLYHAMAEDYGVTVLDDSGTEFQGLKVWGSPVQPTYGGWAFNREETRATASVRHPWIGLHWNMIPDDTDILITHGPPLGILDKTLRDDTRVGSASLLRKVRQIKPKLHVFGHVHESRGLLQRDGTVYVNAACLDRRYEPYPEKPFQAQISLDTGIVVVLWAARR